MVHLYFLLPDLKMTQKVLKALKAKGVTEANICLVTNEKYPLEPLNLNAPGILQTPNVIPALEMAMAWSGATAGLLAGLAAVLLPSEGLVLGGRALLAITHFEGSFDAWVASLIGISAVHPQIERFRKALDAGKCLLLISVEKERELELRETVMQLAEPDKVAEPA